MPIRNFFKRSGVPEIVEPSAVPADASGEAASNAATPAETTEYQLCEINDSGVFVQPSPEDKPSSFWSRSNSTLTHRSILSETEPFSISRESFDSYRRSFDISARAPIPFSDFDQAPRQSLDSRTVHGRLRIFRDHSGQWPKEDNEDGDFEDVRLDAESKTPAPAKKRSLFARFGDNSENGQQEPKPAGHHSSFLFAGRKRGQSGQGSELRSMPVPGIKAARVGEVEAE